MAKSAVSLTPTREDFESLLAESYSDNPATEGSVVKGRIVSIENDFAIIDVGLKTEGKIAVKEFAQPGRTAEVKVGDTVEVYLERIENAMGEAVLSRDKARREEAWTRLEQMANKNERVDGVIFGRVKGGFTVDLGGAVAFLPGSQVDVRPIRDYILKTDIEPVVAPAAEIASALDRHYGALHEGEGEEETEDEITLKGAEGGPGDAPIIRLVNQLVFDAHRLRGSDIHTG